MAEEKKEFDPQAVVSGVLDVLGLKIDLSELLTAPENLRGRLEELREKLKEAGGKETSSAEEWRQGGASVTGYVRTRGLLGDQEFHIGTTGRPQRQGREQPSAKAPEFLEPPVDVFDEGQRITIVADVPGVTLDDLVLTVQGGDLTLSTRSTARRGYRKEVHLEGDVDPASLQATCHNGVLEVHLLRKQANDNEGPKG
jgi:HSP20 family protein